jgi:hypothetical protein
MTADTPLTVNVSTPTHPLPLMRLDMVAPQRATVVFWLAYRWLSLLPVCAGMVAVALGSTEFSPAPWFLLIALGSTLLITIFSRAFPFNPLETAYFLLVDLTGAAGLLAFSGNVNSPYFWYALSPLLAGVLLFQWRGALWSAGLFTLLYLLVLPMVTGGLPLSVNLARLLTQIVGFWLVPLLLGYPLRTMRQLEQKQEALQISQASLTQRHVQLLAAHDQLEIIHDVTLLLQGASELQSVQQRVLRAVA